MPLLLLVGAIAAALAAAGITWFGWEIYARVGTGGVQVGIGGPGSTDPGAGAGGLTSWLPIALLGTGALLILLRR